MKLISSSLTFLFKYIFSGLWYFFGGISILAFFSEIREMDLLFYLWPAGWVIMSTLLYFTAVKLKQVKVFNDKLFVSNYIRKIEVGIFDIKTIEEHRYFNPELVTLKFRSPTEFGEKIIFMPSIRLFKRKEHPAVSILKEKIKMEL